MKGIYMRTEKFQIYKCDICGNIVQVLLSGGGELVCCGEKMNLLKPQTEESEMGEKHIPKIEEFNNSISVNVNKHPMLPEHYIKFIEVVSDDASEFRVKYFSPDEKPEFELSGMDENVKALEYCNVHGLWGNNND